MLAAITVVQPAQDRALIERLTNRTQTVVLSFVNQHAFNIAYLDPSFRSVLASSDVLLRDGIGIELALKLLGRDAGINMNGTDFIPRLLEASAGKRLAVFGTCEPWLGRAVSKIGAAGPNIVASLDGFQSDEAYVTAILKTDPDIVLLGMGMPKQEMLSSFLAKLAGKPRLIINGGAILDFYGERFPRAPETIRKLRLEWAFRLVQEPRRLARRYLLGGLQFGWRIGQAALRTETSLAEPLAAGRKATDTDQALADVTGVVIVSPGGLAGRGGMGTVTRIMAEGFGQLPHLLKASVLDARGGGSAWAWPAYFCVAAARLIGLRLGSGASILHLQVSERSSFIRKGLLLALGQMLGMKTVLHHHGAELIPTYHAAPSLMRWWMRRTIRHADFNIVLGVRWRNFLLQEIGASADRVSVLYNASPDLAPSTAAVRDGLARDPSEDAAKPFHILLIANLCPRKGISEFLSALRQLKDQGLDIKATLAGGGEIERYKAEAASRGLAQICTFAGWVDRNSVVALMASADCLALPSYEEGLPMAILEALSCRLPVVATPVGSIGEVLNDGKNCLLVQPGDVDALATALRQLASDGALRQNLAENGRRLFDDRFMIKAYMQQILRLYGSL